MFSISRKSDYGLLVMAEFARRYGQGPVSLKEIATKLAIPYPFLTQVVIPLRHAKLLDAKEGRDGGYYLARDPKEVAVSDVLDALAEKVALTPCQRDTCPRGCLEKICPARTFWWKLRGVIQETIQGYTLSDLMRASLQRK